MFFVWSKYYSYNANLTQLAYLRSLFLSNVLSRIHGLSLSLSLCFYLYLALSIFCEHVCFSAFVGRCPFPYLFFSHATSLHVHTHLHVVLLLRCCCRCLLFSLIHY